MATRVVESAVLPGPVGRVWELLRPFNFAYLKRVREVKVDPANPGVGGVRAVTYADGTVQQLKLTTVSEAKRQIGWDVIGSEPAISVLSVSHQLQLFRVTTDDATFVEWETLFSADASTAVTEDARFKQRENFAALRDALTTAAAAAAAPKPAAAAAAAADRKDEKAAPAGAAAAGAGAGAALKVFEWETPKREMLETAEKTLELAAPLAAAPNAFQKVRLSGHSFSPLAAQAMAPVLAKTSALQVVDISDVIAVRSTPDVVAALTTLTTALAANNKGVTELNVSDNALGLAGVQACKPLLEAAGKAGVAKLQVLKFNNNGLEGDAAEFITKTVLAASGKPTALRYFEIHNNCLTDDGAKGLAPLFAASPLLERIRFTTTRLSDEGGDALVKALVDSGSRAFVSIELGDNSLGEDAGMLFATKVLADQPRLQHLGIGDTGFGAKALAKAFEALAKTAPNLQVLDLNNLEIDAKLALRVAELIKAKPSLTRVSLEGNDFGDKGAAAIVAAVADHKGLTELNLNGTALSSKSIAPLFAALKGKAIAKLSLNANRFNAKGVAAIKDAVKAMGLPAKALDSLSDNEDDDDDATDVADAMAKLSLKK